MILFEAVLYFDTGDPDKVTIARFDCAGEHHGEALARLLAELAEWAGEEWFDSSGLIQAVVVRKEHGVDRRHLAHRP